MDIQLDLNLESGRKVYTVAEITRGIRFTLEDRYSAVWVEGEISNFNHHGSGHMYFSLKDAEATLQCVMFRQENARLRFRPEDGMKILIRGRVSVYPARGQYQLVADAMEPKGLGALQAAFEQLKKKLSEEGLFDPARKRPIPFMPHEIGVITSLSGAAVRDVLKVAGRRFPGTKFLIRPVQVQGDTAKIEIAEAFRDLNENGTSDVILLTRGGGSIEDLWPFNEEIVARAIVESRIPVVSAVGHEVDTTIADYAADLRAPTPSAAAEMLLPQREELEAELTGARRYLDRAVTGLLDGLRSNLETFLSAREFKNPKDLLIERSQELDDLTEGLKDAVQRFIDVSIERLRAVAAHLEALGPLACLTRGFSVTFDSKGKILKSAKSVLRGDRIRTRLDRGEIMSRVEEIHEGNKGGNERG